MRSPNPRFSGSFPSILALLLGVTLGQHALAGPEVLQSTDELSVPDSVGLGGQQVYNEVCIACHAPPGLGGAPALGDKAAWAPRLANGVDTLIGHALNGFSGSKGGIMPKKGGRLDLSDEEITGAVRYMVEQVAQ